MRIPPKKYLIAGLLIILVVSAALIALVMYLFQELDEEAEPFSLENAPKHIIEIKTELKSKFQNESITWDDMDNFVTLAQYIADNSPERENILKNWRQTVLFDFADAPGDMWFFIRDSSLTIKIGADIPQDYGILIELNWATFIDIMKQDETPLSAYVKGDLEYEGPFDEVLKIADITKIAAATIMDTYVPQVGEADYVVTVDQSSLYISGGLTLFPIFDVSLNPDHIGEHHKASIGSGSVVIVDQYGEILTRLETSSQTVHKFINSTTIMMGGQESSMQLWNYKDNSVVTLPVPGGHHDIDYNPITDTFMVLEYVRNDKETWDGKSVMYDFLSEYNQAGDLVWQWNSTLYFPFNASRHTSLGLNETFRGSADWMHANSFAWDKSHDLIYLNVRNLDTILAINYTTKEVIWDAGRGGDFTLLNKAGEAVDTIFCHPHSLERIGSDRFIIYDNDLYNQSNPSTMSLDNSSGHSRYLEFEIDEENHIMREIWSWTPPNDSYYFPESGGDADRLPNGNTVGIFGDKGMILNMRDPVIITEVTRDGQIAWELQIPGINDTYYWVHRMERFYEKPLITIHDQSINLDEGILSLNISTWDIFKQEATSQGTAKIVADGHVIYEESFEFLPQWQPNTLEISLTTLPSDVKIVDLVIENSDGVINSAMIYQKPSSGSNDLFSILTSNLPLVIGAVIAIPLITIPIGVILWKKIKKPRKHSEEHHE